MKILFTSLLIVVLLGCLKSFAYSVDLINNWVVVKKSCVSNGKVTREVKTYPDYAIAPKWWFWRDRDGTVKGRYTWPHKAIPVCINQIEGTVEALDRNFKLDSIFFSAVGNTCFAAPDSRPPLEYTFSFVGNSLIFFEAPNNGISGDSEDCRPGESLQIVLAPLKSFVPGNSANSATRGTR
jgi:hypothetical protein